MPPRSAEEKARRKALLEEKKKRRQEEKEKKAKDEAAALEKKLQKLSITDASSSADVDDDDSCQSKEYFTRLSEDMQHKILCFLSARDLGCASMSCRSINYGMAESRVAHSLSRLKTNTKPTMEEVGKLRMPIVLAENRSDVKELLDHAIDGSGDTGRLVTKKSKKGKKAGAGDADEYISYARFIEEAIQGYALQKVPGQKPYLLPPIVNGRFASASPEHTLVRIGGDGGKSGAGGSGCTSWGVGKRGQLGHGKRKDEHDPRMMLGGIGYGIRIVQVSAGGGLVRVAHSLLLTATGGVLSFGIAQYGALGHGYSAGKQLPDELRPKFIKDLAHLQCVCVSAGELHSAVVTADGDLFTWGDGFCGQLGIGDRRPKLTPQQVEIGGLEDEVALSVSCGARHTLVITEDFEVWSFGLGHFGVLGRSFSPYQYHSDATVDGLGVDLDGDEEEQVDPLAHIAGIDAAMRDQINLLANLSLDDSSDQCIPMVVDSLKGIPIVGASAGHRHSLFLDAFGNIYTCGDGSGGALGHGNVEKQDVPAKVMYFADNKISIIQISAGVDISMAISTTGAVYGWGNTKDGVIGLKTDTTFVNVPHKVCITSSCGKEIKAVDVECGYLHSVVVGCDGSLHMCGNVDTDEDDSETSNVATLTPGSNVCPIQVPNLNVWHRLPEPREVIKSTKWQKYGKYELKGRSAMMATKQSD